ncbi:hypothetical protein HK096_004466 [Nowakowskiella sp. JEL0078]|nr:hypothetical protein HK096_004466 [Nowakowskiella sp. JEL0078]
MDLSNRLAPPLTITHGANKPFAKNAAASPALPFGAKLIAETLVDVQTVLEGKPESVTAVKERGIEIAGWKIVVRKGAILNSVELDSLAPKFINLPYPEMFFGHNSLTLTHSKSNITIVLSAVDGLSKVFHENNQINKDNDKSREEDASVFKIPKVAFAEHWATKSSAAFQNEIKGVMKQYDWTYTTDYSGTINLDTAKQNFEKTNEPIDIQHLMIQEPILFYDELTLYEDELHDNGVAVLGIRVRVMASCLFILLRFFLRVDGVLFRINETRFYHRFTEPCLIREIVTREDEYSNIKLNLPKPANFGNRQPFQRGLMQTNDNTEDLSLLTDANWVSNIMANPFFGVRLPDSCNGKWIGNADEESAVDGKFKIQREKITLLN